jgi:hypothetical protein
MSFTKTEIIDVNALNNAVKSDSISDENKGKLRAIKKRLARGNELDNTYKLGKNIKSAGEDLGRLCAVRGIGLQGLPRQLRGALGRANYHDIDIVNALPTICYELCVKQGIACANQKEFIGRRDELMSELCEHLQMDRDMAKTRILALYFGYANASEEMNDFFKALHSELTKARELICTMPEWAEHIKFLRGKDNRIGRGFSYILQTIERSCLLELDRSATRNNRSLDVFIHDGGLIRKLDGEKVFPSKLLAVFEADIAKSGWNVKLSVKPLTTDLDLENSMEANYTAHKREFEKTCFKLNDPPCYVRLYDAKVSMLDLSKLGHIFANDFVDDELFINKWRADPEILTYEKIDFLPELPVPQDTYNLWRGFPVSATEGDVSVIRNVLSILCNHNQKDIDYVENYVAHMFQKPGVKPGVCIVVSSEEEGVGKETFWNFIGEMVGSRHFFNTTRPEDTVFGRFNGSLKECILLKFEEADFETNKKNESGLRGLITGTHTSYESKNENAVTLRSYCRPVMTTNAFIPFVMTDTDRRFFMIRPSNEKVGDREFWNSVYAVLDTPEAKNAYYHYLMNRDISTFNPRGFHKTEYSHEVVAATRPMIAQFFQRAIERRDGRVAVGDGSITDEMEVLDWKARDLLDAINRDAKYPYNEQKFGREMKKFMPTLDRTHDKYGSHYRFRCEEMRTFLRNKHWWIDL